MTGMEVGVTGGSGVVGSAVVRHLLERGDVVHALARSDATAGRLAGWGTIVHRGDVLDHPSLVAAFRGCEVVYHVAGVNELCPADAAAMYRVNVDGSRQVLRACAAAGVRRMVHTSSATTIGETAGVVADELTPHRGAYLSEYERSKHHAERALLAERTPVEVVVVNPSSVQGPGRATGTAEIILRVLSGRLRYLVEVEVSMIDIDDCARGHRLAAEAGRPGHRYVLSGFTLSVTEAVSLAAAALDSPLRPRILPSWVAASAATLLEPVRWMGARPPICREMWRVAAHGHRYDGSRATRELGLEYTSAERTFQRMVAWFRSEGLL